MRAPKNVNFCTFVECAYLEGQECSVDECIFNSKLVDFWIWHAVHDIVEPVSILTFNALLDAFNAQVQAQEAFAAAYNEHTHNYRRVEQLGVDGDGGYAHPVRVAIEDDAEVEVTDANKTASVGLTVATEPTSPPV